ncbi:MAG: hypothetical protein ACO1RT_14905 [Planctomycetaceae bacterium]
MFDDLGQRQAQPLRRELRLVSADAATCGYYAERSLCPFLAQRMQRAWTFH